MRQPVPEEEGEVDGVRSLGEIGVQTAKTPYTPARQSIT
jgi:hypothetical protein